MSKVLKNPINYEISLDEYQKQAKESIVNGQITILTGGAGTGKTSCTVQAAVDLLFKKEIGKILVTRPIVEVGKSLGFLPGELNDKYNPFIEPVLDSLYNCYRDKEKIKKLLEEKKVEGYPIAYIRGKNMNDFLIVDECIPKDYYVDTDKGKVKIKNLKIGDNILTFNEKTFKNEYRKLTDKWSNGIKEVDKIILSEKSYIEATNNHVFYTVDGVKKLSEITTDDILITKGGKNINNVLNSDQKSLIVGSILGDGGLQYMSDNIFRMKFLHSTKQEEYCSFKLGVFRSDIEIKKIEKNGFSQKPAVTGITKSFILPISSKKDSVLWAIENIDLKALAIMIQDDGYYDLRIKDLHLHSTSYSLEFSETLSEKLNLMGYENKVYKCPKKDKVYYKLRFTLESTERLLKDTSEFFHVSMAYKNPYLKDEMYNWNSEYSGQGKKIKRILRNDSSKEVYDLTVEDNHNFYISKTTQSKESYLVHNCQNLSELEIRAICTRLTPNGKIVFVGDIDQNDTGRSFTGLHYLLEMAKAIPEVHVHNLKNNHRSDLVAKILTFDRERQKRNS